MADAKFWDNAAEKYAKSPIKDMQAYEATLDRTRHYLKPGDHLLEIGCGTGTTALTLSESVRQITATDLSPQMLGIAKGKRRSRDISNVAFVESRVGAPLADAPFDAICAFSILHLVDDLPQALAFVYENLKPGGHVISKTTCLRDMNFLIPPIISVMKLFGKAPEVQLFDAHALERAFSDAGFELVETGYFGKNTATRFIVARRPA